MSTRGRVGWPGHKGYHIKVRLIRAGWTAVSLHTLHSGVCRTSTRIESESQSHDKASAAECVYVLCLSLITVVRYPAVLERSTIEAAKQNGYFLAVVSCYLINKNVVNNQSGRRGRLREEAKSIHSECEEN